MYWLQIIVRFVSLLRLQSFSSTHDVVYNLRNTGQDNINSSILLLSICSLDAVIYQQSPWNLIWCAYQTRSGVCVCVCVQISQNTCVQFGHSFIYSVCLMSPFMSHSARVFIFRVFMLSPPIKYFTGHWFRFLFTYFFFYPFLFLNFSKL